MDIAVPHSTGLQQAVEVEQCACPVGYTGPSCQVCGVYTSCIIRPGPLHCADSSVFFPPQDCDIGYTRSTSGLYLGTCERCQCGGHSTECDGETGECLVSPLDAASGCHRGISRRSSLKSFSFRTAKTTRREPSVNAASPASMASRDVEAPVTASRAHAAAHPASTFGGALGRSG